MEKRTIDFITFMLDLHKSIDMISKKDMFDNIQFYLERKLSMEYITSCSLAGTMRDAIFQNKKLTKENMGLKLLDVLNAYAQDHVKKGA